MAKVNFITLWNNHPGYADLCNFKNQCAIRMGVTFLKSGINMSTFSGVRCWEEGHNKLNHTLRAQELADWIKTQPNLFGPIEIKKKVTFKDYRYKQGLVFFKSLDGEGINHIDLWNGHKMKAGRNYFFPRAMEIWFWDLP